MPRVTKRDILREIEKFRVSVTESSLSDYWIKRQLRNQTPMKIAQKALHMCKNTLEENKELARAILNESFYREGCIVRDISNDYDKPISSFYVVNKLQFAPEVKAGSPHLSREAFDVIRHFAFLEHQKPVGWISFDVFIRGYNSAHFLRENIDHIIEGERVKPTALTYSVRRLVCLDDEDVKTELRHSEVSAITPDEILGTFGQMLSELNYDFEM